MIDERLSREKGQRLLRIVNGLRQIAPVEVLSSGTDEDGLLKRLMDKQYSLVIVPWYRYQSWSRVEAYYGLTRTSGPTFVGYFGDTVLPYELGDSKDHFRAIFLDFHGVLVPEAMALVKCLATDSKRYGLRPFYEPTTSIYCDTWYQGQTLGPRIDALTSIPEVMKTAWIGRASAIRSCFQALWSLIHDEGNARERGLGIASKAPRAYFQVAADTQLLTLRLCYSQNLVSPKDALQLFWPDASKPTAPSQFLLKYADFLRVHTIADTADIEVVAGFFASAPSENAHTQAHSLWIEPLSPAILQEAPYELPGAASPQIKALMAGVSPSTAQIPMSPIATAVAEARSDEMKDRLMQHAAQAILDLKKEIAERDELIRELRAGGVGTEHPLPLPDAEALLEAFQERYMEARYQIRQIELEIEQGAAKGFKPEDRLALEKKISSLTLRQNKWLAQLSGVLAMFGKKDGTGG